MRGPRYKKQHHDLAYHPPPPPLGAHVDIHGVQFSIFSRHATRVWLLLFKEAQDEKPFRELELDPVKNRMGDVWHIHVRDAEPGMCYVYRMEGTAPDGVKNCYDPDHWLLDPYAMAVTGPDRWGDTCGLMAGVRPENGAHFPKGVIMDEHFDWSDDITPGHPLEDSIIYETHVRGYTKHPSAGVKHGGTYQGLIEKLPYLRKLGVTTIELLPVYEFNEMEYFRENDKRHDKRNFWGYSTMAFFAPMGRYAAGGNAGQQVREFQNMVKAIHKAGMEVILDVVFNHTAEGGKGGPTYSFRGIENQLYYMLEDNGDTYKNYTGCGNTVNCNHPVVSDFIVHSLRYWVQFMHVDGFRFDLASIFCRGQHGEVLERPPIVERISEDPVLGKVKLIAEAWDAAGLYQVGSFPHPSWSEWNGRYRDDIRSFWRGDAEKLSALATRLAGSSDLYDKPGQYPQKSINFLTSHDGFTLRDIVSYNEKHNLDNSEENRDGDDHNHSFNCGIEGDTDDPEIRKKRLRFQKNMLATLFLSQGVPMLLAGDEFGRTQQGNNNAYCQDNEISWVNWTMRNKNAELLKFAKEAIAFRKAHPVLRQRRFMDGYNHDTAKHDIRWYGPEGKEPDWHHGKAIGCQLHGDAEFLTTGRDDKDILILINNHEKPVMFHLPEARKSGWQTALSTEDRRPRLTGNNSTLRTDSHSVNVLISG